MWRLAHIELHGPWGLGANAPFAPPTGTPPWSKYASTLTNPVHGTRRAAADESSVGPRALSLAVERGPCDERGQRRRRHVRPTAAAAVRRPCHAPDGLGLFAVQRRPLRVRHGVDGRQRQMRQLVDGHVLRTHPVLLSAPTVFL